MHRPASLPPWWTLMVVCLALAVSGTSARQTRSVSTAPKPAEAEIDARRAELEKAIDAYAAGDRAIVGRIIREQLDPVTRAALMALMNDRHTLWNQARAAFTLEVAVVVDRGSVPTNMFLPILWVVREGRNSVSSKNRDETSNESPNSARAELRLHPRSALAQISRHKYL